MQRLNFIPNAMQLSRARQRRLLCWSCALIVGVIAVALPLILDGLHRAEAARLTEETGRLQADLDRVQRITEVVTKRIKHLSLQLERSETLRSKRAWSGMLALISSCLPEGGWLTGISTVPQTPTGAQTQAKPVKDSEESKSQTVMLEAPRKLLISGFVHDPKLPYALITNLKEAEVFSKVALLSSQQQQIMGVNYSNFEVECEW